MWPPIWAGSPRCSRIFLIGKRIHPLVGSCQAQKTTLARKKWFFFRVINFDTSTRKGVKYSIDLTGLNIHKECGQALILILSKPGMNYLYIRKLINPESNKKKKNLQSNTIGRVFCLRLVCDLWFNKIIGELHGNGL